MNAERYIDEFKAAWRRDTDVGCRTVKQLEREAHLLELLGEVDADRAALHESTRRFLDFLNTHDHLQERWDGFIASGGATATQLKKYLLSPWRPVTKSVPHRGLIRLVVK